MEKVRCPEHGAVCLLKTGTREGPNKGRSFYVCPANRGQACPFTRPTELPPSRCLLHDDAQLDLQALVKQDPGSYRLFYRCMKSEGKKFCGSVPWKEGPKCKVTARCDLPAEKTEKPQRNPFKVINDGPRLGVWKQVSEERKRSSEESGEVKAAENQRNNGEEKTEKIQTKRREEKVDEIGGKSSEEAKRQEKNPNDRARRSLEEKTSNQGLKNSGEETRPQNNATDLGSDRGRKVCEADNREKPGRTSESRAATMGKKPEDRSWSCEVRRTQSANDGGQKVVEDSKPSFQGWREKELPAGVKIKKKLPEEMVQKEGESSKVTSVSPSDPRQEPADDDDVVFVSSQPGKDKVTALRPSGEGKQRTITSFPGFTPQAEGPSSAAQHAMLSAQLQQKKATLASINLKALPDGGGRLLKQVQDLEDALGSLSLCSQAVIQPGRDEEMRPKPDPGNVLSSAGPAEGNRGVKPLSFHELPPSALGLQGLTMSQNYSSLYGVAPQWQSLYGGRMTEEKLFAVRNATSEAIDHLHKSLESCPGPENTTEDPRGLKVPLLLHQKQALAWLQWREAQQPQGGILADDMGLGKTLTMIALILAQKQQQKSEKEKDKKLESWISKTDSTLTVSRGTLIICPASLVHHWKKEVEKRVSDGRLRVYLYHGANREKDCKMLAQYDIVVTTYSLVSKEIPAKKEEGEAPAKDQDLEDRAASSPLLRLAWARIILDEAHNIKNPKVQTSIAVCKLRAGARWAVTGTPIQNNLLDLYSLLRFLRCSPFDEFKLWKSQVDNGSRKGGERLTILTKSLLLRRTKDQLDHTGRPLVDLPQRTSELHQLTLSPQEQAVYDVIFARSRSTLQHYLRRHGGASHTDSGSADNPFDRVAREFGPSQGDVSAPPLPQGSSTVHILSLLLRLRQCCGHLSLLKTTLDQLELKNEGLSLTLEEQLNALTLCDLQSPDPKSTVSLNGTNFQAELFESESGSTKTDALISRLKTINSSAVPQKSVIVSQWTSMLRIVAVHLKRIGMSHATIDGSVNPKLRMDLVEEFNTNPRGPQVMLVSLCAGGVGLNLIGGNHLFLMDMHWNPALEDQACDRIYRVGQDKDVVIHRFVCQGTVEEKISQLQEKKKDLAKKVLAGNGSTFTKLTLTDLRLLFGV
ncbi:transcription termination factor 2 [Bufo bufo]|uniref:transcription termination factor 2 n=1 Tax=Bufo bufo TaxID=8384 RepID=UPI001ABDF1B3|nr:transcription termination factor 2 [Bufo bufo]XP_040278714.1 transcription termination factor 2 [Bufo bufo]XP_040278715.1 transcription termination factor 2 [Bufo bufo]